MFPRLRIPLLFLALFTAACVYWPSFSNGFIWDDHYLIVTDSAIRDLRSIGEIFRTSLYHRTGGSNFYRPIQSLSFMIDYSIWKLNPFGYHLTNFLLHLLNTALIYLLVNRILRDQKAGILAALIFAVHPINTEAVTYMSARSDPLSAAFLLGAFLLYIDSRPFLSAACFACGLLTKESAIAFPLVFILYDVFIKREHSLSPRAIARYAPYILAVALYIVLRFFILGLQHMFLPPPSLRIYLLTMPKILVTYVFLIFFPFHLYMERITLIIRSIFGAQAVLYIALLAALAALYAFSYRRSKQLFFFASFFLVTLLPVVNILVINAPMAEHWLYLPSVGAYAVISACLSRILSRKGRASKAAAFILIIFLAFFCVRTVMRNIEWGRPFEFYRRLLKYTPDSYRGHNNLGALYLSEKDLKSAKEEFDLALRLKPDDSHTLYILGRIAMEGGDEKEALRNWKKCLDAGPFYRPGQEAVKSYLVAHDRRFRRALRAAMENPGSIRANYRLSKIYINHGLYIDALYRLENVLEADPKYANALFNRAWIYSKLSMWQKAIAGYKELMTLTPKDPDLYANLSYCYKAAKQLKEAQTMWDKAASLGYKKDR